MGDIVCNKEYWAFMKMAKSYKILFLIAALFMAVAAAFGTMSFTTARAETASNPLDYLSSFSGDVGFEFKDNNLVASIDAANDEFAFDNKLVIDDLSIVVKATNTLKNFTIDFVYDSYFVNGNKNADGEFDTQIKNSFEITNTGSDININVKVENNQIVVNNSLVKSEPYYRIRTVSLPVAKISFTATELDADTTADFSIISVDQKASDVSGKYKQTFELDSNNVLTDKETYPRVSINDSFYRGNSIVGYSIVKQANVWENVTLTPYTFLNNVTSANVWLSDGGVQNSNLTLPNKESTAKPKSFTTKTHAIGSTVDLFVTGTVVGESGDCFDKFTINVVNGDEKDSFYAVDNTAPEFVAATNVEAYEAFEAALNKAIRSEDDAHYIHLGSELELPSMQDLVYDDQSSYAKLKDNATVYYNGSNASKLSFKLNEAGKYLFYVVFADEEGNKMDVKDIYNADEENPIVVGSEHLVFDFEIFDDAPIQVNSFEGAGLGYKGVSYTAPSFKIDAGGCTTTYTLYFNADKNAQIPNDDEFTAENGWVAIPKASSVTDKSYNKDGYNYNTIKSIGYDGGLTFTPNKTGTYVIECTATSETTSRSDTGLSIVRIENAPQIVKVPSTWLQDNVWSVVFLSIGTLCLIGIVVLLFIKPKEEKEEE